MITLRKRFAGPHSRHMLLPAVLFVLGAFASVAASETTRTLCAPGSVAKVSDQAPVAARDGA